jgi:hypothetical protein
MIKNIHKSSQNVDQLGRWVSLALGIVAICLIYFKKITFSFFLGLHARFPPTINFFGKRLALNKPSFLSTLSSYWKAQLKKGKIYPNELTRRHPNFTSEPQIPVFKKRCTSNISTMVCTVQAVFQRNCAINILGIKRLRLHKNLREIKVVVRYIYQPSPRPPKCNELHDIIIWPVCLLDIQF